MIPTKLIAIFLGGILGGTLGCVLSIIFAKLFLKRHPSSGKTTKPNPWKFVVPYNKKAYVIDLKDPLDIDLGDI